jgi:saccharopine dehydrogenase-like NADP-dependent oxidoreductase
MSKRVVVLGGGLVGGVMAGEMASYSDLDVVVVDRSGDVLHQLQNQHSKLQVQRADLSEQSAVKVAVASADLVISAVPGFMGFKTCEAVIAAGKDLVDIAFFSEDPFLLDEQAKRNDVTVITDCGVSPGMSNVLIGRVDASFDQTESILIYVGGLPRVRTWPFEYKAVFSPIDVIEEYVRPARYIENGVAIVRPALSDPEYIDFEGIGTLEAFNTDGLRTLARTMNAPNQKEKTLRYSGHIEKMAVLREMGLFSEDPIEAGGVFVRPIDVTSKLLFPMWELQQGEEDLTVLRIVISGVRKGKRLQYQYDMFDSFDAENNITSMARTTGYTATVVSRLMLDGHIAQKGLVLPEYLGRDESLCKLIQSTLESRHGIFYKESVKALDELRA